ncbi:bifunctional DNA-binding transcriptional regulator/O6-methylguanine-DNA methyltransferase Ada [Sphingomonas naphthae]|uniref:Bifunctional DNA-binding transcriptional regulator/O6-methylguanine-DNA methyltransferase Ada n=1 Tax=Sphingomonas naphthae TaxID=1813468 RepID=A0ABY7TNJ2_9SPHN|nr:bifunctional DNA-binding transcriptional regulator/O6-methylguanine-DNA methyltransferase Ada [Sphingomonas naphthae]WCT74588.1 bifunctional DNA-binding transcriptional regulator/O6-methylguanine-DNA methyltransferase Ada [Sphingomonas naphthae]
MTTTTLIPAIDDPRWARIVARDASADGDFYYSVLTTGVYCRPSCASRGARPENVAIHASLAEARATGFRPCRRCDPEGIAEAAQIALVTDACRRIEASETPPSLGELAADAGFSESHFHRLFRRLTGLTPRAYAAAHRAGRVREGLAAGQPVTAALHEAGFGSASRFYEGAGAMLGMAPSRFRQGGARETLRFAIGQCSLGAILVASSDTGVAAILLGDDPQALVRDVQDRFPKADLVGGDAAYEAIVARAVALVEAPGIGLDLPLDIRGTAFQQRVWQALAAIPAGETRSYADVARAIGAPAATRAVAGACAANALAIAIPCHRVVRNDGGLSGYRWGVERKRALLDREGGAREGEAAAA